MHPYTQVHTHNISEKRAMSRSCVPLSLCPTLMTTGRPRDHALSRGRRHQYTHPYTPDRQGKAPACNALSDSSVSLRLEANASRRAASSTSDTRDSCRQAEVTRKFAQNGHTVKFVTWLPWWNVEWDLRMGQHLIYKLLDHTQMGGGGAQQPRHHTHRKHPLHRTNTRDTRGTHVRPCTCASCMR